MGWVHQLGIWEVSWYARNAQCEKFYNFLTKIFYANSTLLNQEHQKLPFDHSRASILKNKLWIRFWKFYTVCFQNQFQLFEDGTHYFVSDEVACVNSKFLETIFWVRWLQNSIEVQAFLNSHLTANQLLQQARSWGL